MAHIAELVTITEVFSIPPELANFVHFGAKVKGFEPEPGERVALLRIRGTESYHPVFLDRGEGAREVGEELGKLGVELDRRAREAISRASG